LTSPLAIYNETAEQFGITAAKQVNIRQKLAFAEAQAQEQMAIINRLLFDITTTKMQMEGASEDMQAAHQNKLNSYENDLRQLSRALDSALAIKGELDKEFKKSGEEA
jgi:hypothetical protein